MKTITSWMKEAHRDLEMDNEHAILWQTFIDNLEESTLSKKTVLDYGCGPGGFLRMLHSRKPFERGIGIDLALNSIDRAKSLKKQLPIDYYVLEDNLNLSEEIDMAFSHEVIFLIPDLDKHAQFIHTALKCGGIYYAVTGCHTNNPLWKQWKLGLEKNTVLPVQNYSPENIADAFLRQGFSVKVKRLVCDYFVPVERPSDYFPSISEMLDHYTKYKIIFRLEKN